jgi:hypothetical protein
MSAIVVLASLPAQMVSLFTAANASIQHVTDTLNSNSTFARIGSGLEGFRSAVFGTDVITTDQEDKNKGTRDGSTEASTADDTSSTNAGATRGITRENSGGGGGSVGSSSGTSDATSSGTSDATSSGTSDATSSGTSDATSSGTSGGGGGSGGSSSGTSGGDANTVQIGAPPDITTQATGTLTQVSLGTPVVTGSVDPSPVIINDAPPLGFLVGVTKVIWTATDSSGNYATAQQTVTVLDTTPPTLIPSADIVVEATGSTGAIVNYSVQSASDQVDGALVPVCIPTSGSTFPLGVMTVTCAATDSNGNMASNTFDVTVNDTTPPSIVTPNDIVVDATGISTLVSLSAPTVHDVVDPSPSITNDAPVNGFPVGITTVTWIATDDYGNSDSASQLVTVLEVSSEPEYPSIFDVTAFGATPNDSSDDTKSITSAIASAIANGTGSMIYFSTGSYIVSDTLFINGGSGIALGGTGTIKMSTMGKDVFHIKNTHGILITDISIQGWQDGTKSEFDAGGNLIFGSGIRVTDNSDNITVQNCKIFNQNLNGITMVQVSLVDITNCEIYNTRTSIRLNDVNSATVSNNYLHEQKADAVYVLGTTSFQHIDIINNNIRNFGDTALDITGTGSDINVSGNNVQDAYLNIDNLSKVDPNGLGISISNTITDFQIVGNNLDNISNGMSLDGSNGTITNNKVGSNGISANWTELLVQDRYVVLLGDGTKAFEQFGMSVGGSNLQINSNTLDTPAHVAKPIGWDLDTNKIRNYGIKGFGSNNQIANNSFSLNSDKIPLGSSSETSNVLNYGIKIGGSASGVTVDSNGLHVMTAASYNSVIEKSSSNTLCVQLNNNIIVDGEAIDLIKGF